MRYVVKDDELDYSVLVLRYKPRYSYSPHHYVVEKIVVLVQLTKDPKFPTGSPSLASEEQHL